MSTKLYGGRVNVVQINPAVIDDGYNPSLEIIYNGNQKIFRETFDNVTYEKIATYDTSGRLISVTAWQKVSP